VTDIAEPDAPRDNPDEEVEPGDDGRFDSAYVGKLRAENADRRTRARELEETLAATEQRATRQADRLLTIEVERATAGILADPTDLLTFTARDDLVDEDGEPDAERIQAAAHKLVGAKPHLQPRLPLGDVDQGPRGRPIENFDLSAMLRNAAG